MKERLQKRFKDLQKKQKSGFTLIELIVVLVILGIILAITVPAVTGYIDDAKGAKYLAEARSVFVVAEVERAKVLYASTTPETNVDWSVTKADDLVKFAKKAGVTEIKVMKYTAADGGEYEFTFKTDKEVTATVKGNDKITIKE